MRPLILYIATSLDGYIAAEGDDLDWLMAYDNDNDQAMGQAYDQLYERIDCAIMGSGSYEFVKNAGVSNPYPDKETIVFTRKKKVARENIEFVDVNPVAYVKALKEKDGKAIWLVGGGVINALLLEAGLIDEIQVTIVPIALGKGTKLFEGNSMNHKLALQGTQVYDNGMVTLTYHNKH